MSRIFKDDDFILNLERVSLIKKRPLSTESYIYMEGQCIALDRDLCKKIQKAWEEYIEYKESMVCPVAPLTSATASWDLR